MKHFNTVERKRERMEFIYKHREEISQYYGENDGWSYFVDARFGDWINKIARTELGYSEKTNTGDIWCSLAKLFKEMKEKQLI